MKGAVFVIFLPFILPIIVVGVFIIRIILKGRKESWRGEVLNKSYNSKKGSFEDSKKIEHFYTLEVKMEKGNIRNIAVSSKFYDECEIGDKIEKPSGVLYPRKIPYI